MSEMNKLNNLSNMSDEELDAFIKEELGASLENDIKVDEELINKTMDAVRASGIAKVNDENEELTGTVWNNDENKKIVSIKKYIPILSMVACTCIIVMAGSLIYSKIRNKKSEDASLSRDEAYSKVEDDESLKDEMADNMNDMEFNSQSGVTDGNEENIVENESDSFIGDITIDGAPDKGEELVPEDPEEGILNEKGDEEWIGESPDLEPSAPESVKPKDVLYEISKLLNMRNDDNSFMKLELVESGEIEMCYYDEEGVEWVDEEAVYFLMDIYSVNETNGAKVVKKEYDSQLLAGREYIQIITKSAKYYIMYSIGESADDETSITVLEKH